MRPYSHYRAIKRLNILRALLHPVTDVPRLYDVPVNYPPRAHLSPLPNYLSASLSPPPTFLSRPRARKLSYRVYREARDNALTSPPLPGRCYLELCELTVQVYLVAVDNLPMRAREETKGYPVLPPRRCRPLLPACLHDVIVVLLLLPPLSNLVYKFDEAWARGSASYRCGVVMCTLACFFRKC